MGNNKITNLGNPGSPNDAVSKRFLYKRIQKLTNDYSLESVSGNINSIKSEIAELQKGLLSNRKSIQEKSMSLQNEIAKMSDYMRRDRDGSLDGRLDMSNHRISGLADPTDADDAVTRRYVASRFQVLSDEVQDKKTKLDALQNWFSMR